MESETEGDKDRGGGRNEDWERGRVLDFMFIVHARTQTHTHRVPKKYPVRVCVYYLSPGLINFASACTQKNKK